MKILTLNPFSAFSSEVPVMPKEIKHYLDSEGKTEGVFFRLIKDEKSENTGDGMSYYDRLRVLHKATFEYVYNTGYQLWRPGHAFSTNRPEMSINGVKLLLETEDDVVYGYSNGKGLIKIIKCDKSGAHEILSSFNMSEYNKAINSQKEPKDMESFTSWALSTLPNIGGAGWDYDDYHNDDSLCVVICRHNNRSGDATHDAFKIFVWRKGVGVAVSDTCYTHAQTSYRKFSTNYLRCSVSVTEEGQIEFAGKSQFGDVEINEIFSLEKSGALISAND